MLDYSRPDACAVSSCESCKHGVCVRHKLGYSLCEYGWFYTIIHKHLESCGVRYNVKQYNDYCKASISGRLGRVEVWGGDYHASEVWVIMRDKSEKLITDDWTNATLSDVLEKAFSVAGVQLKGKQSRLDI